MFEEAVRSKYPTRMQASSHVESMPQESYTLSKKQSRDSPLHCIFHFHRTLHIAWGWRETEVVGASVSGLSQY